MAPNTTEDGFSWFFHIPYNWRRFGLYSTTEDDFVYSTSEDDPTIPYKWRRLYNHSEDCYFRVLSLYPTSEDDYITILIGTKKVR